MNSLGRKASPGPESGLLDPQALNLGREGWRSQREGLREAVSDLPVA